jgi:hypothetical protein
MNIFDSAIIVSAIAGGVMGGIVAAIISLAVLRGQRRANEAAIAPHTTEWRAPSGPLSRHLARTEPAPKDTETPDA